MFWIEVILLDGIGSEFLYVRIVDLLVVIVNRYDYERRRF